MFNTFKIEVNEWGSSQYAGALHAYNIFIDKFNETNEDLKKTCEELNIEISFTKINNFNEIKNQIIEDCENNESEQFKNELIKSNTCDGLLMAFKNNSYDLWTAVGYITPYIFKDFLLISPICTNVKGPIFNREVQSQNTETGIECALLTCYDLIKNEESFMGFDT